MGCEGGEGDADGILSFVRGRVVNMERSLAGKVKRLGKRVKEKKRLERVRG